MKRILLVACLFLLAGVRTACAQLDITFNGGSETALSFNYFSGPGADPLAVTPQGLGSISGLVFVDNFTFTQDVELAVSRNASLFGEAGLGIIAKKYRFDDNLIFDKTDGYVNFVEDTDPTHDYDGGFFSPAKTKLVLTYLRVPFRIGFKTYVGQKRRPLGFSVGYLVDVTLGAKHKAKYFDETDDDDLTKIKTTGVKRLEVAPVQFGVSGEVFLGSVGLRYTYMLTETFRAGRAPEVYGNEIALVSYFGRKGGEGKKGKQI